MVKIENNIDMIEIRCDVEFIRFFKAFFRTYSLKVTWFVLHETLHTTLFAIYCCFEVVEIEKK